MSVRKCVVGRTIVHSSLSSLGLHMPRYFRHDMKLHHHVAVRNTDNREEAGTDCKHN